MKKILTIFIGFTHDFAAGCWASSVFAVYWLDRQNIAFSVLDIFIELKKQFFYLGIACIIVVFATGAGRSFTYIDNVYGKQSEKTRRTMLILKHIFLLAVFGYGTYWQYTACF